jgi:hypothetical protein
MRTGRHMIAILAASLAVGGFDSLRSAESAPPSGRDPLPPRDPRPRHDFRSPPVRNQSREMARRVRQAERKAAKQARK